MLKKLRIQEVEERRELLQKKLEAFEKAKK